MTGNRPFPDALRSAYDRAVLDVRQRGRHATRLHKALRAAGLWRAGASLLDVGCGSGLLLNALGNDVRERVGCDLREEPYARARGRVSTVLFVQADGTRLPFPDGHFDLVTCMAVIEEFTEWEEALREMARCVAPGGLLYVTVTNSPFLFRLYELLRSIGFRVRADWWEYASSSRHFASLRPDDGFGLPALEGWNYIDLTPYLAVGEWAWLKLITWKGLTAFVRRFAPSHGHAWRRPALLV